MALVLPYNKNTPRTSILDPVRCMRKCNSRGTLNGQPIRLTRDMHTSRTSLLVRSVCAAMWRHENSASFTPQQRQEH